MSELTHYGVKGMKWGVRKSRDTSLAPGYKKVQFDYDARTYGKKAARRINDRVKNGEDLRKARDVEQARAKKINRAATLAGAAMVTAGIFGPGIMDTAARAGGSAAGAVNRRANRKREEAGRRAARDMLADERGLTNYSSIRLQFDPTTGEWK